MDSGGTLHPEQIRQMIGKIQSIPIQEYLSRTWLQQDKLLQQLNIQLHLNAVIKNDQFILEQCLLQNKFKIIIYDLICTHLWKSHILILIKSSAASFNSLKIYLAIYHQAVICNMLQILMFHRTAVDESGQFLIEIIDYCIRKIFKQITLSNAQRKNKVAQKQSDSTAQKQQRIASILKRSPQEQLNVKIEEIEFSTFIMSISILRYITDYIQHLQIGIIHHLIVESNIFSLLVPLIEEKPWIKTDDKANRLHFENNKWSIVPKGQYSQLPKVEAQVWITLYNLYLDPQCRKKYEINQQRKITLLRLRKYINQILLDQIPNLSVMLRSLEELSLISVPTNLTSNPFVVQQVPIIANSVCQNKNWEEIAKDHSQKLCMDIDTTEREHMKHLADLYSNNNIEGLVDGFKCGKCQSEAFKRCSKCKSVWYCSRECQVSHWAEHKPKCLEKAREVQEARLRNKQVQEQQKTAGKGPQIDELD